MAPACRALPSQHLRSQTPLDSLIDSSGSFLACMTRCNKGCVRCRRTLLDAQMQGASLPSFSMEDLLPEEQPIINLLAEKSNILCFVVWNTLEHRAPAGCRCSETIHHAAGLHNFYQHVADRLMTCRRTLLDAQLHGGGLPSFSIDYWPPEEQLAVWGHQPCPQGSILHMRMLQRSRLIQAVVCRRTLLDAQLHGGGLPSFSMDDLPPEEQLAAWAEQPIWARHSSKSSEPAADLEPGSTADLAQLCILAAGLDSAVCCDVLCSAPPLCIPQPPQTACSTCSRIVH